MQPTTSPDQALASSKRALRAPTAIRTWCATTLVAGHEIAGTRADDWEQYCYLPDLSGSGYIASPLQMLELWQLEPAALQTEGGCYTFVSHPYAPDVLPGPT